MDAVYSILSNVGGFILDIVMNVGYYIFGFFGAIIVGGIFVFAFLAMLWMLFKLWLKLAIWMAFMVVCTFMFLLILNQALHGNPLGKYPDAFIWIIKNPTIQEQYSNEQIKWIAKYDDIDKGLEAMKQDSLSKLSIKSEKKSLKAVQVEGVKEIEGVKEVEGVKEDK